MFLTRRRRRDHAGAMTRQRPELAGPESIDGDMTPADIAAALRRLKFPHEGGRRLLELDEAARSFLLRCVEARCHK
jgi:hypothetical protein